MKRLASIPSALLIAASVLTAPAAHAEDGPETSELPSTQVHGIKDPQVISYRKAYELVTGVRDATQARAILVFRVISADSGRPIDGLKITVVGTTSNDDVTIGADGFLTIPLDPTAYQESADFYFNQSRGSMRIGVFLQPNVAPGAMQYSTVVESIDAGQIARGSVVPWYARLITPKVSGLEFCYATHGHGVDISGGPNERRAAETVETNDAGTTVYCAAFAADEPGFNETTLLTPDQEADAQYSGSFL